MTWKFWNWDWTGSKRIAALEKRIAVLEEEVTQPTFTIGLWANLMRNSMWGEKEKCRPVKLTLWEKVDRICDHLNIAFQKENAKFVLKKKTKSASSR